jgi:hypothetical protein
MPSLIINVKGKHSDGSLSNSRSRYSPISRSYVQLSRVKTLTSLSILRPFDPAELRTPLSKDLLMELEWQKAKETEALYI